MLDYLHHSAKVATVAVIVDTAILVSNEFPKPAWRVSFGVVIACLAGGIVVPGVLSWRRRIFTRLCRQKTTALAASPACCAGYCHYVSR